MKRDRSSSRETAAVIRILVGSDNVMVRDLLEIGLAGVPEFSLAGSVGLNAAVGASIAQLTPNVTVLMPKLGFTGSAEMAVIEKVRSEHPGSPLITVAPGYLPQQTALLYRIGVAGILLESQGWSSLVQAIRSVNAGDFFSTKSVANAVMGLPELVALTDHEIRLVGLVSEGLSNTEIASRLNVSESTVRSRLSNVLIKLNVINRTQAVTEAIRLGYVQPKPPDINSSR